MAPSKTFGPDEIHAAIEQLAAAIMERHPSGTSLLLLGIANGGIELARRVGELIGTQRTKRELVVGTVDISFHRDDIGRNPIPKELVPTHIPVDVHGATVILVDDVLFSGRTVKAALDEIFDHGRPTKVELAVLIDRGGRRLPFAADYCGLRIDADPTEKVVVRLDPEDPANDAVLIRPATRQTAL